MVNNGERYRDDPSKLEYGLSMAKYLYRTCPKCKDYLGVVVPEPPEPVKEVLIDAHCAVCGFKLDWKVVLGQRPG